MAAALRLPRADGTVAPYAPSRRAPFPRTAPPARSRVAYAAVHVVADPLVDVSPTLETALDWEATLAYRRYVWSLAWASPRRWTPPSGAWALAGRPRRR